MLYLILHKVRGEPTFDIASPITIGLEKAWIIPTSGHRCYPYKKWRLEDLTDTSDINSNGVHDAPWIHDTVPADWPDHYANQGPKAPAPPPQATIEDLLI